MFYEQIHSSNHHYFTLSQSMGINFSFPMHLHENYEFIYVEEGVLRIGINDCEFDIAAGEGAFVLPNQPHKFQTPAHSKCWLIIFSADYMPELKKITANKKLYHPILSLNNPKLYEKFQQAQHHPLRIRALLYELAACYVEGEEAPQLAGNDGALVCKIVEYIDTHYTEPITLQELSRALGYSYRYMSGVVNRFFKQPLPSVVNRYRIHYACDLLSNTDKAITEIALICGFGSMRNFNRNFQLVMGKSPRAYRKG